MANLKAYRTEREKYPWQQRVRIKPELCQTVTRQIAREFGLYPQVYMTLRRGGGQAWAGRIELCRRGTSLGTIIHEVAHCLDYKRNGNSGHTGKFWDCLHTVYAFATRAVIKKACIQALQEHRYSLGAGAKAAERAMRSAERKAAAKASRQTREYKMERLRKRIKGLETRSKRINTLLKSAKRSLSAYERAATRLSSDVVTQEAA